MKLNSLVKAAALAGIAAVFAPATAAAGGSYDIFPTVIEGIGSYDTWHSETIVKGAPPIDGTVTFDTKNLTNAVWEPELVAHADGGISGIVNVEVVAVGKGLPPVDEVPVVGRSRTKVSEKGLVLSGKAITNDYSFAAAVAFAGTKTEGAGGNAFSVKFAGKAKQSIKPGGTTGSRDLAAKVGTTVGSIHKGSSVVVVDVDDVFGIGLAYGVFYGEDPVVSPKAGTYTASAFFLSDFAAMKGLSDGSVLSLKMTPRKADLPLPKILPGQFGKFSIKAADGPYKFSGKGYHLLTAEQIAAAGTDLEELLGGGYLGTKFAGPAGSHSRTLGIGGGVP